MLSLLNKNINMADIITINTGKELLDLNGTRSIYFSIEGLFYVLDLGDIT